jgi:holo-[acyl-carrier protein] synthase
MIETGVDIQEVKPFKKISKHALDKIFSTKEVNYCVRKADSAPHYAVRFAAKEAVMKAFSSSKEKLHYKDIEILIKEKKPYIEISKKLKKKYCYKVSLSHSGDYAIASVIITEDG